MEQLGTNNGNRFKDFDVLVMAGGVHTIVENSKIRSIESLADRAIKSYQRQLESMILVKEN